MTHGFSSTDKSKKPMNCYYDFDSGKFYAYDSNEELQEITLGGGGGMPIADFTKPYTITSGVAVTKDVVVFLSGRSNTTTMEFKVNNNQVYSGNASVAGDGAQGGRVVLHTGDVPTWAVYTVKAFEVYTN